jgi:hypothetical protein
MTSQLHTPAQVNDIILQVSIVGSIWSGQALANRWET